MGHLRWAFLIHAGFASTAEGGVSPVRVRPGAFHLIH